MTQAAVEERPELTMYANQYTGRISLETRFWEKIVIDAVGCWLWTGHIAPTGYGTINAGGRGNILYIHRVSFEIHYGQIPDGLFVLHNCDVNYDPGDITYRRCGNPSHLRAGTHIDNVADAVAKGRMATGERHGSRTHPESVVKGASYHRSSLSDDKVREIRVLYSDGKTSAAIASGFGVSRHTVSDIVYGRTWKHVV